MLLHTPPGTGQIRILEDWNPRAARESSPARGAASVTPRFRRVNCRRTKVRLGRGPAACVVESFWSSSSPARELLTRRRPASSRTLETAAWPVRASRTTRSAVLRDKFKLARGVVSRTGYGADAPCTAAVGWMHTRTVVRGTSQTSRDLVSLLIRGFLAQHFARHQYSIALIIIVFLRY
jgi:hypothetical protein